MADSCLSGGYNRAVEKPGQRTLPDQQPPRSSLSQHPVGFRKAAALNWIWYRAASRRTPAPLAPRWKVGLYKCDRLGDFVLSLGAIRTLVGELGPQNCVLFVTTAGAAIAEMEFPGVRRVVFPVLSGRLWRDVPAIRAVLKQAGPEAEVADLLCLRHLRSPVDDLAMRMIPTRVTWGLQNSPFAPGGDEFFRNRRLALDRLLPRPEVTEEDQTEILACHRSLLEQYLGRPISPDRILPTIRTASATPEPALAIAPFASERIKDIPYEIVAACVRFVRGELQKRVVLLSPPGERERFRQLASRLAAGGGLETEVVVTPTIGDLIRCLRQSHAVLSADTGPAHLAVALGCRFVGILGGGHFGIFGPWRTTPSQEWCLERKPCYNCGWICTQGAPICLNHITPTRVVNSLRRVWHMP